MSGARAGLARASCFSSSPISPLPSQTYDPREGYNPQPPDLSGVTLSRELQVRPLVLHLGVPGDICRGRASSDSGPGLSASLAGHGRTTGRKLPQHVGAEEEAGAGGQG